MNKTLRTISLILTITSIIIYSLFSYNLMKLKIFPHIIRTSLLLLIAAILLVSIWIIKSNKHNSKSVKIISIVLMAFLIFGQITFVVYASKTTKTIEEINNKDNKSFNEMSLLVSSDSKINSIEEVGNQKIATAESFDTISVKKAIEEYKNTYNINLATTDLTNYQKAYRSILNGKNKVMLLNESYRPVLEEAYPDFSKKTKIIGSVTIENDSEVKDKNNIVMENKPFNIYLSGIDTYGSLSTVSRSDVNMILSVNPSKNTILITTIPRDTYVFIGGDETKSDKLTHAGLFGVDSSIKSIEKLLDIEIDYYGKVNFTSLTDLIDVLGEIKVYNPTAFESSFTDYFFPEGEIEMDGEMALAYSRERYNLDEGDFDRSRNHSRVLTGIIKKMLSYDMLINFSKVSDIALESINTDIPYSKLIELANRQLSLGKSWKIKSQYLKGEGSADYTSYLMPDVSLYMMIPDEDSIKKVHDKIIENNKVELKSKDTYLFDSKFAAN